jgi:hypothetical protein
VHRCPGVPDQGTPTLRYGIKRAELDRPLDQHCQKNMFQLSRLEVRAPVSLRDNQSFLFDQKKVARKFQNQDAVLEQRGGNMGADHGVQKLT